MNVDSSSGDFSPLCHFQISGLHDLGQSQEITTSKLPELCRFVLIVYQCINGALTQAKF